MRFTLLAPPIRRASLIGAAVLLAAAVASAQSASAQDQSQAQSISSAYSSNQAGLQEFGNLALLDAPAPAASASAGGQYGNGGGYGGGGKHAFLHNWTFEAGGGFNGPVGNDAVNIGGASTPVITWGGNFTVGAGLRLSKWVSALVEYQFIGDKLPGVFISDEGSEAGNSHINSITGSPVIDLFPKKPNGVYLVGGWGYYHKSTNFQDYEEEESIYGIYEVPVTVASVTSNQWGGNAGLGIYHRVGSMYGDSDSHTEIFAEARYTYIHTPSASQTNGLGTTELIPVTLGVRF